MRVSKTWYDKYINILDGYLSTTCNNARVNKEKVCAKIAQDNGTLSPEMKYIAQLLDEQTSYPKDQSDMWEKMLQIYALWTGDNTTNIAPQRKLVETSTAINKKALEADPKKIYTNDIINNLNIMTAFSTEKPICWSKKYRHDRHIGFIAFLTDKNEEIFLTVIAISLEYNSMNRYTVRIETVNLTNTETIYDIVKETNYKENRYVEDIVVPAAFMIAQINESNTETIWIPNKTDEWLDKKRLSKAEIIRLY